MSVSNSELASYSEIKERRKGKIKIAKVGKTNFFLSYAYRVPCPEENSSTLRRKVFPGTFYVTPEQNKIERL